MGKNEVHQHLLFYLCPPDEKVMPDQYLDDIFETEMPKGLLWCLIFIKNLPDTKTGKISKTVKRKSEVKDPRHRDPRRERRKEKEREKKERERRKEKEKRKEKSVSLGMEV